MKNLLVILLVLILSSSLSAQSPVGKGTYTLGGSISYSSQSYEKSSDNYNIFRLTPEAGYFFIDNFYTALAINYFHASTGNSATDYYGLGPAIRYYLDADKVRPFLGLSYIYSQQTNSIDDDKTTSTEFKISGGVDYFITDYFALEASVNYSFINYDFSSWMNFSNNSKLFQIGVGVNFFIH